MNTHSYKEALRKQIGTIVVALIIIAGNGWLLQPINTPLKFIAVTILVLVVGIGTFFYVRKNGYIQPCSKCNTNIYPFIDFGKQQTQEVKFCPVCGQKI